MLPQEIDPKDYLFITEVGSRMWRMADLSSDHDLFCCYVTPSSEYLRTMNFRPTKPSRSVREAFHFVGGNVDYDLQFMEIGHLVNLLVKGNINAVWAVMSPIRHLNSPHLDTLRSIVGSQLSQASYKSIMGMATSQLLDADKRGSVRDPQKSLKTCMRTLRFGLTLLNEGRCEFLPIQEDMITHDDCEVTMAELRRASLQSAIPEKPDETKLRDFLKMMRLEEIRQHMRVVFDV